MTLAGPVDFGPEFLVLYFLVVVLIPGLAIAGLVMLIIAAKRYFAGRHPSSEGPSAKPRRSWKFFVVLGVILLVPFIGWRVQQYVSYRGAVETRLSYLERVGFEIYEPAAPPPGYFPDADVNTFRDPPYIDHHMENGVVMTQFAMSSDVEPFLRVDGPCDPSGALTHLTLGSEGPQPPGYSSPQCRLLYTTPAGRLVYGPGEPDPNTAEDEMFTILDDTVIVFRFTVTYAGDLSEVPALVDSLHPVEPDQLTDR